MSPVKITIAVLVIAVNVLAVMLINTSARLESEQRRSEDLGRFQLTKAGSTAMHPPGSLARPLNYLLRSFDGGRTWVALERSDDGRSRVLGEAEKVYPGLLTHLKAVDALTATAEAGKLDLASREGKRLMTDAGFDLVSASQRR